jgi:hypothetical protein
MGVLGSRRRSRCEFEEAAADIRGGLDGAVAVFVGIAHVDEHQRLVGIDAALELLRALLGNDLSGLGQHVLERLHRNAPIASY